MVIFMRYVITEDEKRKIREKYLETVNKLNKYLDDGFKVRPNLSALNRKLNDPKIQRLYKKSMDIAEKRAKRMKIAEDLLAKYKHLEKPDHNYFLDRTIAHLMDERPGAEAYNEALVKTYYLHPEAVAQLFYQKAMDLNPGDIIKIAKSDDADNLFLDYYEKNRIACEFAVVLKDGYKDKNILSLSAEIYIDSLQSAYQNLQSTGFLSTRVTEDYFVFPELTEDQRMNFMEAKLDPNDASLSDRLANSLAMGQTKQLMSDFKKLSKELEEGHYDIDKPGGFSNYIAKDKETNKYVSMTDKLIGIYDGDVDIIKLDDQTSKDIRKFYDQDYISIENVKFPKPIQQNVMSEYLNEFRYRYALNNNKPLYKLEEKSLTDMVKGIRRGFFETIFQSTTDYTKRLQAAIEEFENPRSEDYQNKEKLKEVAQAYLNHRGIHNREEALRESSAPKNRSLLCLDIIAAVDATKENVPINYYKEIDNKKNEINNNKKDTLYVEPNEILKDKSKQQVRKDFIVQIEEDIDTSDLDKGQIKFDDEFELDSDLYIIDEAKTKTK
jgi:hypothetical protein